MSYQYKPRTEEALENLAALILDKCPHRIINGCAVDIEGIIEDFGITIIPRRGQLHILAFGYTPRDPHYIVLAEAESSYPPNYRAIAAEEFCHIALEYDLYDPAKPLPAGSVGHDLTEEQHRLIEVHARYLAGAVLFPKVTFQSRFAVEKRKYGATDGDIDKTIRAIVAVMAEAFRVSEYRAGRRARDLGLITDDAFQRNYPDRIRF